MCLLVEQAHELVDTSDAKQCPRLLGVPSVKLSEDEFLAVFGAPIDKSNDDSPNKE